MQTKKEIINIADRKGWEELKWRNKDRLHKSIIVPADGHEEDVFEKDRNKEFTEI